MLCYLFFFFNDTATTEIYTLSLHDALPIFHLSVFYLLAGGAVGRPKLQQVAQLAGSIRLRYHALTGLDQHLYARSEEHTSEIQSRQYLVCRLLLEKKKNQT